MDNINKPIKQKASQGGRVMRQERQKESVKSESSAMSSAVKGGAGKSMQY